MRDLESIYNKGDEVTFDGYVVAEQNKADFDDITHSASENGESISDGEDGTLSWTGFS